METLETGNEKIQKICDAIRVQTLNPALEEADAIIEEAKEKAKKIIFDAEKAAENEKKRAREEIEKDRNVFESSLGQASKQAVESLRQEIEKKLFQPKLKELVRQNTGKAEPISQLVRALVKALEKEGVRSNLTATVAKSVSPNEVNALLGADILKSLDKNEVVLGDFFGGAKIRVAADNLICDMSDQAIYELLIRFVHNELRKFFFRHG